MWIKRQFQQQNQMMQMIMMGMMGKNRSDGGEDNGEGKDHE